MRWIICTVLIFFGLGPLAWAQSPGAQEVDLELVLLADATGSIDDGEIEFQRQGYADAIQHRDVLDAIKKGALQRIAVIFVEWGDESSQAVVMGWTVIDGPASAKAFATALVKPPRLAFGPNAIGAALLKGKALIEGNEYEGLRKVIDLSADSANNWNGPPIEFARDLVVRARITINGLAILCRTCLSGRPVSYNLEKAFADRIVGGPRAFVITADTKDKFTNAVRRKLVLEIAGLTPARQSAAALIAK